MVYSLLKGGDRVTMHEKIGYLRKKHNLTLEDVAKVVGVGKSTVSKWEKGNIANMRRDKIADLAKVLQTTPAYLMGWEDQDASTHLAQLIKPRRVPILGSIPAGAPVLAIENIEGYGYADVPEGGDYFYLSVHGDSMINAGIHAGDMVLIKMQPCADNGQIVACIINGDEATLKRFYQQKDTVVLHPENPAYQPVIVPCKDFESGYARIIGVAIKVTRDL